MKNKLATQPKTVGGLLLVGTGIVVGAMLWWFGGDVYKWVKTKCGK